MEEQVEEEFWVWKKNTPLLYDLVVCHSLEWPSLTVQWLPSPPTSDGGDLVIHKLILGTHTSDGYPNHLMVANAFLPRDPTAAIVVDPENAINPKVDIIQNIRVDGEVNRARCMPQNQDIVAAKTNGAEVYVFDSTKQMTRGGGDSCDPEVRLRGHDKEGYGLSWSPFKQGYLLSGSHDCKVCLWDVSAMPENKVLEANYIYEGHENVVGDVSWHLKNENLFGSVGDDCRLMIWDLRTNKAQHSVIVHEKEVNYLSFNPFNEWVLATASSDTTVGLFDIRNLSAPLHALSSHEEDVLQVEWNPSHETILASSAEDRRLMVWDLNRVGDEQLEGEAKDGPAELLFSHGGHKAKITDFSWNKNEPWTISSVAEDNTLQIWQMAESIYREDDV